MRFLSALLMSGTAACALAMAGPALAQVGADPSAATNPESPQQPPGVSSQSRTPAMARTQSEVSEVVVTANRRDQNLQSYAGVAQVLSADTLKQANIGADITNLSQLVPGLNIANQEGNIDIYIVCVCT